MNKPLTATVMLSIFLLPLAALAAGPRDAQWKQVDEAVNKGLPKTAIERLEPIIEAALKDKAYGEAVKAIGRKLALEATIEGNKPQEKIVRMQAEIAKAPPAMVPVMEAILANWYWHYFQQNRWRILRRTATAEPPSEDFTTWALPRLLAEIDKQFTRALSHEEALKKVPVTEFDELLVKGNVPDSYRPTLFDFLAYNALGFYAAGEQAGAKAEDAFDLLADSPIFSPAEQFLGWKVETADTTSPTVKAIGLYQNLLRFHQDDADRSAFLDADLARLVFGHNKAFGEEKDARFKAALKRFTERWGDHPIAARALHRWASVLRQEGELVAAHALASRGWQAFPESVGGRRCFNLVQEIESPSLNVTAERVWNEPWPEILVRHRNLKKIHFRAVPAEWLDRIKSRSYRLERLNDEEEQALLRKEPALAWSADLPATDDYHERTTPLAAPKNLQPGFYYLIASHDPGFGSQDNVVTFTDFWVSTLALITRSRTDQGVLEGFVLDAESGDPIAGADVRAWYRGRNSERVAVVPTKTDKNGLFRFDCLEGRGYTIYVTHQGQALSSSEEHWIYYSDQPKPRTQTVFFTDRSLYRPGQTIQYKGVCIRFDHNTDNYHTLANQALTVMFRDRNGKEIARQQHRTNDYGSFSGSFTAPRDRLLGRMSIQVEGEPRGQTAFNVEEYKRPKFEVKLAAPETPARLNGEVTVAGTATAYTGAAVDGAQVRWRVVREVRYPAWWGWYYWWRTPRSGSQEIAHGRANTDVAGQFDVTFTAKPDPAVSEEDEPIFRYSIYADVTDTSGETRSAQRTVQVGFTTLAASLSAGSWLTDDEPVQLGIRTQTLDGEGQQAEGSLRIYRLAEPAKVERPRLSGYRHSPVRKAGKLVPPPPDRSNANSWELGEVAAERGFTTDPAGDASLKFELPVGVYRAVLKTRDRFGKEVTARLPLTVLDPDAKRLAIKVPSLMAAPAWSVEPGAEFAAVWGTGYSRGRAFVEIEHRRKLLQAFWTDPNRTQVNIKQAVTEAMRGGFTLRITMVRENRAHLHAQRIDVPWTNKQLSIAWEHFVSTLGPGEKETWTAVITGPGAQKAVAEMVAGLYDESLDAYLPHGWMSEFGVFRYEFSQLYSMFDNRMNALRHLHGTWTRHAKDGSLTYRTFPPDIITNLYAYQFRRKGMANRALGVPLMDADVDRLAAEPRALAERETAAAKKAPEAKQADKSRADARDDGAAAGSPEPGPDLSQVTARKNLNETAFFFPHLMSDEEGRVRLEFTMPEALTRWKFLGFAHDQQLRAGLLTDSVVTAKDLMVQPNPPRFLREGDQLEFTVKVTNQSPTRQTGKVRLTLTDARTGKPLDARLGNSVTDLAFDVPTKQSKSFAWRLNVPDGTGPLAYKAVGSTGRLSDGEEGFLPVLSRRILVTESLPLPIRGPQTKQFEFTKLKQSGDSDSLQHQSLTVQMVSNPAWYAVMALPYLMEFPHECTEQTFNRFYANGLARHIANSDPKIRRIFDQWKGTAALDSPLEKNEDLKAVVLEETPWVRQTEKESQARRNVGILFDENRLNDETARNFRKLAELQRSDGAWPWFPGGPANDYITLYIATGFGRMRHLGIEVDVQPAVKSLARLDGWIDRRYRDIVKAKRQDVNNLTPQIALYLYGRSFFLKDKAVDAKHKEAVDFFLGQAKKHWLDLANRQSQAHLAVALKRFGDRQTPSEIMRSIKERSVTDDELGRFWRDLELSWWWFRAPIETQAMMIEAFDEVMNDAAAVEECKVWLLKQKQTQDWKTTKATADAVYALLLRGSDLLASDALVEVSLAGEKIEPGQVEAGTGYYEHRFPGPEIKPQLGDVTVKKVDRGVAWGSVHWQYLEDMSKVTPYEGTPLQLKKVLYTKELTGRGPVLQPVRGPLGVGDELVVRVELRVDRDMEYVHLKDYRGSGTEPVNVLSRYKYQDGLAYYESTRDTASHFFIDYLPKGIYVFEYSTRVVHKGRYQTGMAQIECMYAPEFNSHSESFLLEVR